MTPRCPRRIVEALMSVRVVRCPNEHPIRVPDDAAGKKVKCKECGAVFVIPAAKVPAKGPTPSGKSLAKKPAPKPAPSAAKKTAKPAKRRPRDEDEDDEEEERPRRRRVVEEDDEDDDDETPVSAEDRRTERLRDRRQRLNRVNLGLLLHTIKMWASVVLIFAVILMVIFGTVTHKMDDLQAEFVKTKDQKVKALIDLSDSAINTFKLMQAVFTVFSVLCIVAAPLIGIVGSGFCLLIPKKSGANGTVLTTMVFDVICLVGLMLLLLASFGVFGLDEVKNERFKDLLKEGCGLFTMMSLLLFMVFLRQLAAYLSRPLLGSDALNLVMYLVVEIVTFPAMLYAMGFLFNFGLTGVGSSVAAMGFMFVLSIVWFAQYYYLFFVPMLRLLDDIRNVIEPKRAKEEDDDEDEEDEDEDEDD
jgi:hypothetical protein